MITIITIIVINITIICISQGRRKHRDTQRNTLLASWEKTYRKPKK